MNRRRSVVYAVWSLTFPRGLWDGPYWWRALNAWWLPIHTTVALSIEGDFMKRGRA